MRGISNTFSDSARLDAPVKQNGNNLCVSVLGAIEGHRAIPIENVGQLLLTVGALFEITTGRGRSFL
jgi:hypothetical protein